MAWHQREEPIIKSDNILTNPSLEEVDRALQLHGRLKALYDPVSRTWFVWPLNDAFHADVADYMEQKGVITYSNKMPYERHFISSVKDAEDIFRARRRG